LWPKSNSMQRTRQSEVVLFVDGRPQSMLPLSCA
jgi:hypothetical protein